MNKLEMKTLFYLSIRISKGRFCGKITVSYKMIGQTLLKFLPEVTELLEKISGDVDEKHVCRQEAKE